MKGTKHSYMCYARFACGPYLSLADPAAKLLHSTHALCRKAATREKKPSQQGSPAAGLHAARLLDARLLDAATTSAFTAFTVRRQCALRILQLQHFSRGGSHLFIQQLCTCARGAVHGTALFGVVLFGSVIFFSNRSPFDNDSLRPCLLTCFAAFIFASIIFALLLCWRHLAASFIVALSPSSSFLHSLLLSSLFLSTLFALLALLSCSQRGSQLQCAA